MLATILLEYLLLDLSASGPHIVHNGLKNSMGHDTPAFYFPRLWALFGRNIYTTMLL